MLGYSVVLDRSDFHADAVVRNAVSWLEAHVASGNQQPFFLDAVGQVYTDFHHLSDEEVVNVLNEFKRKK